MTAPRTSSMGCLGCFSFLVMTLATVVQTGLLMWLNPTWLDRMAFWREEPYPVDAVDGGPTREFKVETTVVPQAPEDRYLLLDGAAASVDYDPNTGASLKAPDGAVVHLPDGAIRESLKVTLTPVLQWPKPMQNAVCGPAYELRIGSHEHYTFGAPVQVTLPYLPQLVTEGKRPVVCVWERDRWVPVKTRADAAKKTVTAELPHASPLAILTAPLTPAAAGGLGGLAVLGGLGWVYSSTERGTAWALFMFTRSEELETKSFKIHYYKEGTHAVPKDSEYPLAGGRPSGDHPLYVQDIAAILEKARAGLGDVGLKVPVPKLICHDVFLYNDAEDGKLKNTAYGSSPPGGPLFIHPRLDLLAANDSIDCAKLINSTVVHELIHLAQDDAFGGIPQRFRDRWWIEATAEYLSERWWRVNGATCDLGQTFYLKGQPTLPAKPMETSTDPGYYAWSAFLHWLDQRQSNSGYEFCKKVYEEKSSSLETLDGAAQATLGRPLGQVFEEFARDFYHEDLWRGTTIPLLHTDTTRNQAAHQSVGEKNFIFVYINAPGGAMQMPWAMGFTPPVKHLTAHAAYFQIEGLSEKRKAKLVVSLEPRGDPGQVQVYWAADAVGSKLPAPGNPSAMSLFGIVSGQKSSIAVDKIGKKVDRVMLMFLNRSLSDEGPSFTIERWLLMPPETVRSAREEPGKPQWKVNWDRVDLQDFPQVFKGYNLYRRKVGDPESSYVLVESAIPDTFKIVTAPDNEDYVYTVKVLDQLGNESEPATIEDDDPFQGEWDGEVALVKGEFAKPLAEAFRQMIEKEEKEALAKIAKEPDPAKQSQMRKQLQEDKKRLTEFAELVNKFVSMVEEFARLGIPMKLKIRRVDAKYFVSVPEVLWAPTESAEEAEMVRKGPHTLGFKDPPKDMPPLFLRLHRKDEIREKEWVVKQEAEGKTFEFSFRWSFRRKKP